MTDSAPRDASNASPLVEADPRSLDAIFNSKPPFDAAALRALIAEMRRMREKWKQDEVENKQKKAKKAASASTPRVADTLFDD